MGLSASLEKRMVPEFGIDHEGLLGLCFEELRLRRHQRQAHQHCNDKRM